MLLKMKLKNRLLLAAALFISILANAQDTVFIIAEEDPDEKESLFEKEYVFSQIGLSFLFTKGDVSGFGVNAGIGLHHNKWIGVSINSDVDWLGTQKLFTIPVYGSIMFNPQIDDTTIYGEVGLGQAFAIGRGDLSGFYQKYKIGLLLHNEICIFAQASVYGFRHHEFKQMGCVGLGMSILSLE